MRLHAHSRHLEQKKKNVRILKYTYLSIAEGPSSNPPLYPNPTPYPSNRMKPYWVYRLWQSIACISVYHIEYVCVNSRMPLNIRFELIVSFLFACLPIPFCRIRHTETSLLIYMQMFTSTFTPLALRRVLKMLRHDKGVMLIRTIGMQIRNAQRVFRHRWQNYTVRYTCNSKQNILSDDKLPNVSHADIVA